MRSILTLLGSGHQNPAWNLPMPNVHVENSWWWAEEMPETCRFLWQQIWIISSSGWLFKKKYISNIRLILCCRLRLYLYSAPFKFLYVSYSAQFVYLISLIRGTRFYTLFIQVLLNTQQALYGTSGFWFSSFQIIILFFTSFVLLAWGLYVKLLCNFYVLSRKRYRNDSSEHIDTPIIAYWRFKSLP
jgi:hypothetical protein